MRLFPLQSWCNCMNVRSLTPRKTVVRSIIESDTLLSKLQMHVAMNESDFPVAACMVSRCVVQICVFYFGMNFEAIWALRRRLKRRICDANIDVLCFVWWLVIRVVTWTSGREGETQIILSYTSYLVNQEPIPLAARPKAWVCDRLLAATAVSNPTVAWTSVSCECCALSGRGLCDGLVILP
jgi:hypothetical protein